MASATPDAAATADTSDLVVVANRLPIHRSSADAPWETSPGGLVSALLPILREQHGVWIGWAGTAETVPEPFLHEGITAVPVPISADEVRDYYEGFSNSTLCRSTTTPASLRSSTGSGGGPTSM